MTCIPGMPEHSCQYIDEIIHWLDPDAELDTRFEDTASPLTREEIIEHLEKVRTINQELRDKYETLHRENQRLEFKLIELQL